MAFVSSTRYFLICITIIVGFAAGIELGEDIQTFVPSCAQPCLESFIVGNYPLNDCTSSPTLQCLCPMPSNSGYTVGEGALQCISAEQERGVCSEGDAGGSIKHDAYLMCSNVANAVANTHSILTATIAGNTGGGAGSVVLSTMPTGTSSGTVPTSSLPGTATSETATSGSTPTTGSTGPTATATDGPAAPSAAPDSTPPLSPAQIAGIVAGVAGAILITLCAILIARFIRNRRFPDLENGFTPTDESRSRSAASGSKKGGRLVISPPFRRFSNPQPEPQPEPQPSQLHRTPPSVYPTPPMNPRTPPIPGSSSNLYLTPNLTQEAIGLAISRSLNTTPASSPEIPAPRRPSRLLPAKPALSLRLPPPRPQPPDLLSQPPQPPPAQPQPPVVPEAPLQAVPREEPPQQMTPVASSQTPYTDRASVFSNVTGFADLDTEAPEGGQIWRPPTTDPQSATTLYVADKWGNWVLSKNNVPSERAQVSEAAELDTYTPLTKSPIEKKEEEAALALAAAVAASSAMPGRPQPAFLSKDPSNGALNRSSSVYSQASAIRRNSRALGSRNNSSRKGSGFKLGRSDTNMSYDSVTTINTSSSSPFDEELPFGLDDAPLSQLPTVMETSTPTTGRSPVKYPKIPGRFKIDFTNSPPGQPSPTIPVTDTISPYPPPLKPKRPQRSQLSDMARNPDVETNLPPPPPLETTRPSIPSPVSRFSPRAPNVETFAPNSRYPERLQTPPTQTSGSGFSPTPPFAEKFLTPSPVSSRSATSERPPQVPRAISPLSMATTSSAKASNSSAGASAASSLLAKRIGNDKAAALALATSGSDGRKRERWRRHGNGDGMLGLDDGGFLSPKGTLPLTPTWQPKLTPTRLGDDLYLNVQ
ncbi:hypothetical protein GGR54DRAFT_552751 [Hypoxylon sp. NC1633]|nr:hypothetical protein GGR54DRAFT_552751 [Hypoxylon sp. NC1633]